MEKILFFLGFIKGVEVKRKALGKVEWGMGKIIEITYQLPSGNLVRKTKRI